MKTKKIATRSITFLLALAMICSLCVAGAAPASAASTYFNIGTSACQGNASSYDLPAGITSATVGQRIYANIAATSDVRLKTIEAYVSVNGGGYTLLGRETANNYMRWAYFPYTPTTAGTVTILVRVYYTDGRCGQGSLSITVKGNSGSSNNAAKVSLNVPYFMQTDSRWSGTRIGSKTIGQVGCIITSVAMAYSYNTRSTVYPPAMKNRLSFNNNDLSWSSLSNVGMTSKRIDGDSWGETKIMTHIYQQLKAGKPVVVFNYKGNNGHAVVVTGYTGTSSSSFNAANFTIQDPNNTSRTTLASFWNAYPEHWRIIY